MVKAHVFSGSLAFQRGFAKVERLNNRQDIGMCVRPLSVPPTEKLQEKTYEKTTLFIIHYRLIIFALFVYFGYQLLFVVLAVAGKAAFHPFGPFDKDGLREFFQRQPIQNDMHPAAVYEGFNTTAKSANHLTFPSQMPPLITRLFHPAFSLSAHKI